MRDNSKILDSDRTPNVDPCAADRKSRALAPALIPALVLGVGALGLGLVALTALWPRLDILAAQSALAFGSGRSAGVARAVEIARQVAYGGPYYALGLAFFWQFARMNAGALRGAQRNRNLAFLALVYLLGPGLIVNFGLKGHSHRPRPHAVAEVMGQGEAFRPFYDWGGACLRNCSFSSGETSAAFATLGPALLAPPHWRLMAVSASLAFGALVGLVRMLAGGHFLSDVAFSAALMCALTLALQRIFRPKWR
jgi:lipid A 4'-phosphatase